MIELEWPQRKSYHATPCSAKVLEGALLLPINEVAIHQLLLPNTQLPFTATGTGCDDVASLLGIACDRISPIDSLWTMLRVHCSERK